MAGPTEGAGPWGHFWTNGRSAAQLN